MGHLETFAVFAVAGLLKALDESSDDDEVSALDSLKQVYLLPLTHLMRLQPKEVTGYVWNDAMKIRRERLWRMVHSGRDVIDGGYPGLGAIGTLISPFPTDVPLQQRHRGPGVLPDSLADIPCHNFTVPSLLFMLNKTFHTNYDLSVRGLRSELELAVLSPLDFGRIYSLLRPGWHSNVVKAIQNLDRRMYQDSALRLDALDGDHVVNPTVPPRRLWDLYGNRVVPFWVLPFKEIPRHVWAVSHSWVDENDRTFVKTPINDYEWPVPIPRDTTLEHIRIELLNLGAEYVWLDVLCLRQETKDAERDELKKEEWKTDIPMIGHVYQHDRFQTVISYFNGLGRPFIVKASALDHKRHWLNRVWTAQETTTNWIPGGLTRSSPDENGRFVSHPAGEEFYRRLNKVFHTLSASPPDIFQVLNIIRDRHYSTPIDQVSGTVYLLKVPMIPLTKAKEKGKTQRRDTVSDADDEPWTPYDDDARSFQDDRDDSPDDFYDVEESLEKAWSRLIPCIPMAQRSDLLLFWPEPGDGADTWRPSWHQLMAARRLPHAPYIDYERPELVKFLQETRTYYNRGYVMDWCELRGFNDVSVLPSEPRYGMMTFQLGGTRRPEAHSFPVIAKHSQRIPTGNYFLVGYADLRYWVVARVVQKWTNNATGRTEWEVRKVSVLEMDDKRCRRELWGLRAGWPNTKVYYI